VLMIIVSSLFIDESSIFTHNDFPTTIANTKIVSLTLGAFS